MDIFSKIEKNMSSDLAKYASVGHGYFTFPKLEGEIHPHMMFRGKPVLTWSLNNYLGLCNHPEVRKADAEAAAQYGMGYPMGSRMLTGNTDYHEEFEAKVAEFTQKEAAFLLNFGYQGVLSSIPAITDRKDVIVYDQLAHACLMDGMVMSQAKRFVFRHNDMEQFEDRLKKAERIVKQTGGGILVITEGVFGMKGDLGNLGEIVKFKERYNFRLMVDDAHGFGVMGATGMGTGEHFGVQDQIDLYFSTFAKSLAGIGAFFCGDKKIMRYLMYTMRSQIYAKSLPMPMVIGGLKRLEMLRTMPELRTQLWSVVKSLQEGLRAKGFDIGVTQSPVTPVYLKGSDMEGGNIVIDLRENHGIFASIVTYPVVEKGELMLRLICNATHTQDDVDRTIAAFEKVRENIEKGVYNRELALNAV